MNSSKFVLKLNVTTTLRGLTVSLNHQREVAHRRSITSVAVFNRKKNGLASRHPAKTIGAHIKSQKSPKT